jgi:hypothetical protein
MTFKPLAGLALLASICAAPLPAMALADVKCTMAFSMAGWSAFYKTASGTGLISCSNGEKATVKLSAKGGGLTVGRSTIEDGYGEFSSVVGIEEILGTYVSAEAHAGAVSSASAMAMTKGNVSLALSGKGRGVDLGIAFGKLIIER